MQWLRLAVAARFVYAHPPMKHPFKNVVLAALASLLFGCIVVDDFGAYWNKGFVDVCVNEIVQKGMSEDSAANPPVIPAMRSLQIGNHTFLMMRDHATDKGGNMIRYNIKDGQYVPYRLNENKRKDFLTYYPDSTVVLTTETAKIPVLNEKSVALLNKIAGDDSYWVENERSPYNPTKRIDCIRKP